MRNLIRELETEKKKKQAIIEASERKAREIEMANKELEKKVVVGDEEIQTRLNDLRRLKADNEKAEKVIRELERQSDFNKMEVDKLLSEIENERRKTMANEEGMNRKIRSMEEEKRKLEHKIKTEADRGQQYEAMLRKVTEEREEERRQTMVSE